MKKTNLIASLVVIVAMLLTICGCNDNTSSTVIEPQFQVGEQATYQTQMTAITTENGIETSRKAQNTKLSISVNETNKDGYVLKFKTFASNSEFKHPNKTIQSLVGSVLSGFSKQGELLVQTDKTGQLIDILNFEEINKAVTNTISTTKAKYPQYGKYLETTLKAILQPITDKEYLLDTNREVGELFGLYGKKLKEGSTLVSTTKAQTVTTKTISVTPPNENSGYVVKAVSDTQLNEDYLYKICIKQFEKAGNLTDDAKAFLRKRAKEIVEGTSIHSEVTYEFFSNGWVKRIANKSTNRSEYDGKVSITQTYTTKECIDSKKLHF